MATIRGKIEWDGLTITISDQGWACRQLPELETELNYRFWLAATMPPHCDPVAWSFDAALQWLKGAHAVILPTVQGDKGRIY